jgi:hypothetical protein
MAILFWVFTALGTALAHLFLGAVAAAAVSCAVLLTMAWLYMRYAARDASVEHALSVGTIWLVLTSATELIVTARLGRAWFGLLGPPDHPLLRMLFLLLCVFAPALFARNAANP